MEENPWLRIPSVDYDAHMAEIGQAFALREIFERVYAETNPRRVLVLGCTTGRDLASIVPEITTRTVGVDINADYLATARQQLGSLGKSVELLHGDVLDVILPSAGFDLIHAALLFEYVDPAALFRRMSDWIAPSGVCSVVSQNPTVGIASVSRTSYESLQSLDGRMSLVDPDQLKSLAAEVGLVRTSVRNVVLPGSKSFSASTYEKTATTG